MKIIHFILIFLMAFSLRAAQTNVNDNLLIRNNFQFTGGVVGANKVLTSDGAGYYTPQLISSLGGFMTTNTLNPVTSGAFGIIGSWTNFGDYKVTGDFIATNSIFSVGAIRNLRQADGSVTVDWQNMTLNEGLGGATVAWDLRTLLDTGFSTSLNWGTGQLFRPGQMTLDWASSVLVNAQGNVVNWQFYQMNGSWTNQGSFFVLTNFTVKGTSTLSNSFVSTHFGINTNSPLTGSSTFVSRPDPATPTANRWLLLADGVGNQADIRGGDFTTGPIWLLGSDGAGNTRLNSDAVGTFTINVENEPQLVMSENTITIGNNSTDAYVLPGATITAASGLNYNSGIWLFPIANTTTTSNTGGIFTTGTLTASNGIFKTTTGTGSVNFGTNLVAQIIATSNLSIQALMSFTTNTLTAALPVINTIYTNNSSRLDLNISVNLPSGLTAGSAAAIWQVTGTLTNYQGLVSSEAGLSGAITNHCVARINPGALYMISNVNVTGGTPSLIPGLWNEIR